MKKLAVAALIAAVVSTVAQAEEWKEPNYPLKGWYAGADLGGWRFTVPVSKMSVTGFTYSPFAGYQFNRYLGAQGAYIGGNELDKNINGVDIITHVHVAEASVIGSLPLTGYAGVYARAGIDKWWTISTISYPGFSASASENGTHGIYGAGVYEDFDVVASRLEWTRGNIQGTRVNRITVAAYWTF